MMLVLMRFSELDLDWEVVYGVGGEGPVDL